MDKENRIIRAVMRFVSLYNIICLVLLLVTVQHYHGIFTVPQPPPHGDNRALRIVTVCIQAFLTFLSVMGSFEHFGCFVVAYILLCPAGPVLCIASTDSMMGAYWALNGTWIMGIMGAVPAGMVVLFELVALVAGSAGLLD